jgi:hypothetical protein
MPLLLDQIDFHTRQTQSCVDWSKFTIQIAFIFRWTNEDNLRIVTPTVANLENTLNQCQPSERYFLKWIRGPLELPAPQSIIEGLRNYLKKSDHHRYDCARLAHHLVPGARYTDFETITHRDQILQELSMEDLGSINPTTPILFFEDPDYENENHVAIALWDGLFFSKLGMEGTVWITWIQDLQKIYGDYLFIPK